jgi:hypothetical protein
MPEVLIRRAVRQLGGARAAYPELDDGHTLFIYVGRPAALGNPYRVTPQGGRAEAVAQYREYLRLSPSERSLLWLNERLHAQRYRAEERLADLRRLLERGHRLVLLCPCWDGTGPCHAEVVREKLLEFLEQPGV